MIRRLVRPFLLTTLPAGCALLLAVSCSGDVNLGDNEAKPDCTGDCEESSGDACTGEGCPGTVGRDADTPASSGRRVAGDADTGSRLAEAPDSGRDAGPASPPEVDAETGDDAGPASPPEVDAETGDDAGPASPPEGDAETGDDANPGSPPEVDAGTGDDAGPSTPPPGDAGPGDTGLVIDAGPDAETEPVPDPLDVWAYAEGTWLVGWAPSLAHSSWVRFTKRDEGGPFGDLLVLAEGAEGEATPYFPCSGQGDWELPEAVGMLVLHLPNACDGFLWTGLRILSLESTAGHPSGAILHATAMGYGPVTTSAGTGGIRDSGVLLDLWKFPDSQCDADLTACSNPFAVGSAASLDSLNGDTLIYVAEEAWGREEYDSSDWFPDPSDYAPLDEADREQYGLAFSGDGSELTISSREEGWVGTRVLSSDERVEYQVDDGWAGSYLSIWIDGEALAGELITYGSGVPIAGATRGPVRVLE